MFPLGMTIMKQLQTALEEITFTRGECRGSRGLSSWMSSSSGGLGSQHWALPTIGKVCMLGQLLQLPAQVGRLVHALFLCDLQNHVFFQQLLNSFLIRVTILG